MVLAGILVMTVSSAMSLQAAETDTAGEIQGLLGSILGEGGIADQLLGEGEIDDQLLGEGGIVDQLFGEGGLLEGELPEGTDIGGMINVLKDQLGESDSEIAQVAEGILEKAKEKYDSGDLDSLKEYLLSVLGQLMGDGADMGGLGDIDIEKLFERMQTRYR